MNWYVAKLVFRILSGNEAEKAQFDEQLWLLTAPSETEALLKARKKGLCEQTSFEGKHTGRVSWQFIDVAELNQIGNIEDGTAVHSRIEETDDLRGYLVSVKRKAEVIGNQNLYNNIKTFA